MSDNVTPIRPTEAKTYDRSLISPFMKCLSAQHDIERLMDEIANEHGITPDNPSEEADALMAREMLARVAEHPESELLETYLAAAGFVEMAREYIDRVIDGPGQERDQ